MPVLMVESLQRLGAAWARKSGSCASTLAASPSACLWWMTCSAFFSHSAPEDASPAADEEELQLHDERWERRKRRRGADKREWSRRLEGRGGVILAVLSAVLGCGNLPLLLSSFSPPHHAHPFTNRSLSLPDLRRGTPLHSRCCTGTEREEEWRRRSKERDNISGMTEVGGRMTYEAHP